MIPVDHAVVAERADAIRALVDRHADRPVCIVAVTKRFGPPAVLAAAAAGILDVGENYAQELIATAAGVDENAPNIAGDLRWHFIGHLQRNKVKAVASLVTCWQTVDSVRLGTEIAKRSPGAEILVQVNATGAPGQSGVDAADVPAIVEELRTLELSVRGLMCIGAHGDRAATTAAFSGLRRMADELELVECSMGMSADLVEALEAGSTMIRIGSALFGPRP
jgi:PLP dependent protein